MMHATAAPALDTEAKAIKVFGTVRNRGSDAKAIKIRMTEMSERQPPVRWMRARVWIWS